MTAAHVYAKEPNRSNRWVVFNRTETGTLERLYSTNRRPIVAGGRIDWPAAYTPNGSLTEAIRLVGTALTEPEA